MFLHFVTLTFWPNIRWVVTEPRLMMDCVLCDMFGYWNFSRSIAQTDRQTDRQADADQRLTRATLVGVSKKSFILLGLLITQSHEILRHWAVNLQYSTQLVCHRGVCRSWRRSRLVTVWWSAVDAPGVRAGASFLALGRSRDGLRSFRPWTLRPVIFQFSKSFQF